MTRGNLQSLLIFVPLVLLASCGTSDRLPVYSVEGTVTYNGSPTVGAMVVYHPINPTEKMKKVRPAGKVDAEGRFRLSTYGPKDGAPAGEYRVTVIWPGPGGEGDSPGPDRFRGKYTNPNTSPLKATVVAGSNEPVKWEL